MHSMLVPASTCILRISMQTQRNREKVQAQIQILTLTIPGMRAQTIIIHWLTLRFLHAGDPREIFPIWIFLKAWATGIWTVTMIGLYFLIDIITCITNNVSCYSN